MQLRNTVKLAAVLMLALLILDCGRNHSENAQSQTVAETGEWSDTVHYLEPFDSIGVEIGDSTQIFGDIRGAAYTPDGNLAVLDFTFQGVRFYSAEGNHLYDFTPRGEGPGEFLRMNRLSIDQHGNLFLCGTQDRKVVMYDSGMNMIREIQFLEYGRTWPVRMECLEDSSLVLMNTVFSGSDSAGSEIALFRNNSTPEVIYRARMAHASENMNIPILTGMVFAVGTNGNVYIADTSWETFQITCYSHSGDSLYAFGLEDYEPVSKPDSLLEVLRNNALEQHISYHGTEEGFNFDPPSYYLSILTMEVDSQNRIWVRGERNYSTAEVFSESGEYLYTVESRLPEWQEVQQWNLLSRAGEFLAVPRNPEFYPLIYLMREVTEQGSL